MTALGWLLSLLLAPCASDDGTGGPCYWDAENRGNGQGHSYVVLDDDEDTPPLYLDGWDGRR